MGFCTPVYSRSCIKPGAERMLVNSGIICSNGSRSPTCLPQGPPKRPQAVEIEPDRSATLDKWADYTRAKEAMFFYTDTADAPWTVVKSNDKKGRLNQRILVRLPYQAKSMGGAPRIH